MSDLDHARPGHSDMGDGRVASTSFGVLPRQCGGSEMGRLGACTDRDPGSHRRAAAASETAGAPLPPSPRCAGGGRLQR